MKVAIHQPNYMPWLGYFLKIYLSDVFVFHDDVLLSKSDYTKRTNVRKELNENDTKWLSLSVGSGLRKIKDVPLVNSEEIVNRHIQKIYYLYHNAPFYVAYNDVLKRAYHYAIKKKSLSLFNASLIESISKIIGLSPQFQFSSELPVEGIKNEYNLNICQYFNAKEYLSGMGAKDYQDDVAFADKGCEVKYLNLFSYIQKRPYTQTQGEFLNGLSIIDALMNIGGEGIIQLFDAYIELNGDQ